MTNYGQMISEEAEHLKISQTQISEMLFASKSAVSLWINGKREMAGDIINKFAKHPKVNSFRIMLTHAFECACGPFRTKYMYVDDHPVTVRDRSIQEAIEAIRALQNDSCENKLYRFDFTDEEWERHIYATEQLLDLQNAINKRLESDVKYYSLNLEEMQQFMVRKYDEKGYTKEKQPRKAAV